jgi:hypothetical protein
MKHDLSSWTYLWESGDYVLYLVREGFDDILSGCLIYNKKDHAAFGVEDDRLYIALKKRMKEEGVPIVRERPPGENAVERIHQLLESSGKGIDEVNSILDECRKMKAKGIGWEAIVQCVTARAVKPSETM